MRVSPSSGGGSGGHRYASASSTGPTVVASGCWSTIRSARRYAARSPRCRPTWGERDKPWEAPCPGAVRPRREDGRHARHHAARTPPERVPTAGGGARRQSADLAAPADPRRHDDRRSARGAAGHLRLDGYATSTGSSSRVASTASATSVVPASVMTRERFGWGILACGQPKDSPTTTTSPPAGALT